MELLRKFRLLLPRSGRHRVRLYYREVERRLGFAMGRGPRLHLGCGRRYMPGYINVDLPIAVREVVDPIKVDVYADVRRLGVKPELVCEVRLHHVFEHFDRPTALRLLIDWYQWLQIGATLIIETPDFERGVQRIFGGDKTGETADMVIMRHIFGSHEAHWAYHLDGWYQSKFEHILPQLGYRDLRVSRAVGHGVLDQITVYAKKARPVMARPEQEAAAEEIMMECMVDNSEGELRMLSHWLTVLKTQ